MRAPIGEVMVISQSPAMLACANAPTAVQAVNRIEDDLSILLHFTDPQAAKRLRVGGIVVIDETPNGLPDLEARERG